MKFLIVGDIVGTPGMEKLKNEYNRLIEKYGIDFTIVNGENSAHGKGLRKKEYDFFMELGVDVITMGNHIYYRKEMAEEYIKYPNLLIPINVTNLKANGSTVIEKNNIKIAVISLIGKVDMGDMFDKNASSPFEAITKEIKKVKEQGAKYVFVDFHAEATAEKIAMGLYLKDEVTCLFGTHTHVQTADEQIIDGKMAYITDVGMTGPKDSVIGLKKEIALKRFVEGAYAKYECSENSAFLNAIVVETDENLGLPVKIERINIYD